MNQNKNIYTFQISESEVKELEEVFNYFKSELLKSRVISGFVQLNGKDFILHESELLSKIEKFKDKFSKVEF